VRRLLAALEAIRAKHFERWALGYARHVWAERNRQAPATTRHLIFALCDHYEPLWRQPTMKVALGRVQRWLDDYPRLTAEFRDADGKRPQHTFFFPGEEYRPEFFDMLEQLIAADCGEVELHLHHENDTGASFRALVQDHVATFANRGHFPRGADGQPRYAFIHGDWALANGRPDGKHCGVDDELVILFETGCYADFTFPSIPDVSQPNVVNQIYWPMGDLRRRRSYDGGERARVGKAYDDRILMVTGPVAIARGLPGRTIGIERADLTAHQPISPKRLALWTEQNIHIGGRPEWVFVKAHTHGAPDKQGVSLLGHEGTKMHELLATLFNDGVHWKLHYVTAREMYNIAKAAMAGEVGDPGDYRDYELGPPPVKLRRAR
jgi:hypothetical protein